MADPLGLIGNVGSAGGLHRPVTPTPPGKSGEPGFKELLREQIEQVNQLQLDAKEAIEDVVTGRRDDLESVMIATQKADTAFRMLLQIRNKVMDAYEEVKQMRI